MAKTSGCRCCGRTIGQKELNSCMMYECDACGAIYGQTYLGDSYQYVKGVWANTYVPPEETIYFDITCLGSNGIEHRHGWMQKSTKRIVQVG